MKRRLAMLLCALMLCGVMLGSAACKKDEPPTPPAQTPPPEEEQPAVMLSTAHFSVTPGMMSYMLYTKYQERLAYYDNLMMQFGGNINIPIPGGPGGNALDRSVALRAQVYATKDENGGALATPITWFDYFATLAANQAKTALAVCEAAHVEGITLDASEQQLIEDEINNKKAAAAYYGYSFEGYLAAAYGKDVLESDVREMMTLLLLCQKQQTRKQEQYSAAISDAQVQTEYDAHNLGDAENLYDRYVDCMSYTFTATFKPSTNKNADTARAENEANAAIYEAKKTQYAAWAQELEQLATTAPAQFESKLTQLLFELYRSEGKSVTEAQELAEREAAECLHLNLNIDTSLSKNARVWVEQGHGANDVYVDNSTCDAFGNTPSAQAPQYNEYQNVTSTYTVYLFKSGLHKNESALRSVGHILFLNDTYKASNAYEKLDGVTKALADRVLQKNPTLSAKLMAEELLALMVAEGTLKSKTDGGKTYYEMDATTFEAYGKQYTEDSNVFYADVQKGQMVKPFESWMFDTARVQNEVTYPTAVETEYGWHIMLYRGNEKAAWAYDIRNKLGEASYDAWLASVMAGCTVTEGDAALWGQIEG